MNFGPRRRKGTKGRRAEGIRPGDRRQETEDRRQGAGNRRQTWDGGLRSDKSESPKLKIQNELKGFFPRWLRSDPRTASLSTKAKWPGEGFWQKKVGRRLEGERREGNTSDPPLVLYQTVGSESRLFGRKFSVRVLSKGILRAVDRNFGLNILQTSN